MQQSREHTLKAFDEDLDRLRALISEMGGLAEHAISEAMRCLIQRDVDGAQRVVADDKKLDILEIETERRAVQLIALRAPMASDLRDVVAALDVVGAGWLAVAWILIRIQVYRARTSGHDDFS